MTTIADVTIPSDNWVSINTESGQPIGTQMEIINKGSDTILLQEKTTKPAVSNRDGRPLTNLQKTNYSVVTVTQGSEELWAIALKNSSKISIEV